MKCFVSGASGLVGGNCLSYFKEMKSEVVGSHYSYPTTDTVFYDTLHPEKPENYDIINFAPDVIIHCGALTHVDYCEEHEAESYTKTVDSTVHLSEVAKRLGAKLVLLSTDYVFDGLDGPYTESAIPNPLNVYGAHKLQAEEYISENLDDYLILRITNVYGDELRNKNFISRILDQVLNQNHIDLRLPIDQYASPTNAWDIARAIYKLVTAGKSGIYHIGSTDYMNRVTLAMKVLEQYPTASYSLKSFTTQELVQIANRPLLGGFISEKFNREFPDFVFTTVAQYVSDFKRKHGL